MIGVLLCAMGWHRWRPDDNFYDFTLEVCSRSGCNKVRL